MTTKKTKTKEPTKVNRIVRKYMYPQGGSQFRLIVVYEDHTISVGCVQYLEETSPTELKVTP